MILVRVVSFPRQSGNNTICCRFVARIRNVVCAANRRSAFTSQRKAMLPTTSITRLFRFGATAIVP